MPSIDVLERQDTTHVVIQQPHNREDYQKLLAARGLQCSMSRKGNCWDNAVAERRRHSSLGYLSPVDFELATLPTQLAG